MSEPITVALSPTNKDVEATTPAVVEVEPADEPVIGLGFAEAIGKLIQGDKIRRMEWKDDSYGLLKDGFLTIYTKGNFHQWIVSDGDLLSEDWVTV
jgi:hypothetical protein